MTVRDEVVSVFRYSVSSPFYNIHSLAGAGIASWIPLDTSGITASGSMLTIIPFDSDEMFRFISFDLDRLIRAAIESNNHGTPTRDYSWTCISKYYSGFFSAAAICRLCGKFCIYLNDEEKIQINRKLSAYGFPNIRSRLLNAKLNSNNYLEISETTANTHDATWRTFSHLVDDVLKNPSIRSIIAADATVLEEIDFLKTHAWTTTHGAKLSQTRNEINYRQMHDAWNHQNYGTQKRARQAAHNRISIKGNLLDPTIAVLETSNYLINLLIKLIENINLARLDKRRTHPLAPSLR